MIREGTEAYNAWIATPIPVYTKFYLFSLTNPKEFLANTSKPILEERGPYTFRSVTYKHVKFANVAPKGENVCKYLG